MKLPLQGPNLTLPVTAGRETWVKSKTAMTKVTAFEIQKLDRIWKSQKPWSRGQHGCFPETAEREMLVTGYKASVRKEESDLHVVFCCIEWWLLPIIIKSKMFQNNGKRSLSAGSFTKHLKQPELIQAEIKTLQGGTLPQSVTSASCPSMDRSPIGLESTASSTDVAGGKI